jgi:Glutathione peroxidase
MGLSSSGDIRTVALALFVGCLVSVSTGHVPNDHKAARKALCYHSRCGNRTIYDYTIKDVHGDKQIDWKRYRGNAILLVNVASF